MKPYLSETEIKKTVSYLAKKISEDYQKILQSQEELLVIITLKGAFFFAADLIRELKIPLEVDFVRLTSYGMKKSSSGTVRILKDLERSPKDQHILVLDEIIDSGRTLDFLLKRLQADQPKSVSFCTLLSKPSRREVSIEVKYIGKKVENEFLVGYGLDFAEKHRNLREIYTLEEEVNQTK